MSKEKYLKYLLFLFLSIVNGCIDENPNLLNPPPQTASMYIRFINLTSANKSLQLSLNSAVTTGLTAYGFSSDTIHPPADSAIASVLLDGSVAYKRKTKLRFISKTNYSVIALPAAPGDSTYPHDIDTVISLGTVANFTNRNNTAYIKVLNAVPDTGQSFSVTLGCPSGFPLVQGLRYRGVAPPNEIPAGKNAISLITNNQGNISDSLYTLNLIAGGQYTLIIINGPKLLILDEFGGINALNPVEIENNITAQIRAINFSSQSVSVKESSDSLFNQSVQPNKISSYANITACGSQGLNIFSAYIGNDAASSATISLEVTKKFTVAVFDSAGSAAKLTVVVPPVRLNELLKGRSVVRVVNSSSYYSGFTLSAGARNDSSPTGYRTGELISPAIKYGEISRYIIIPSGIVPLTLFTIQEPTTLEFSTLAGFEPDKNYLIFILDDPATQGNIRLSLVEENDVNITPLYLTEGAFSQFVHLVPGAVTITASVPPVLNQAKLYFSGLFATVMQAGTTNISINGIQKNIDADESMRNLVIAAGTNQSPEIILFQYAPIQLKPDIYKRRFFNACREIPSLNVALNIDTNLIAKDIAYGTASPLESVNLERTSSFLFVNPADKKVLKRFDDIKLPFGKNFTIIFGGDSSSGYTIVQLQEY